MTGKGSGRRGRPLGFKLSEASKRAISISKKGQKHRPETKEKISKSLTLYFRKKNPISEELNNRYVKRYNIDCLSWIEEIKDELDSTMEIMTEKSIRNKGKIEITCGFNIEYFSHSITPELICLFKEYCNENNIDYEDALEELEYGW